MKRLKIALASLLALLALAWTVGSFLPREHRASCSATFRAAPEAIFTVLANVDAYPSWRDVKSVRRAEPIGGKPSFVEESSDGPIRYAVEESDAPRKLVLRIADDTLPYGGTWTFELAPGADGTRLSITEDGFVEPALFRLLAHFVFGYHATMEAYLASLAKKLGGAVTVERG